MGQGAPGSYARSNDHWITLATDGWRDGDIDWAHGGPHAREALAGPWLWLLLSDARDDVAVGQLKRLADHVRNEGADVQAQLLQPSPEEAVEAATGLTAAAVERGLRPAIFFRGDLLRLQPSWTSVTLGEVAACLCSDEGHGRLVLASCSAGSWAFGGKRPWGPHGATHATSRHLDLFCLSQPLQCAFTCTAPELYIEWLMGLDSAEETLAAVNQYPMSAVLALQSRITA